MSTTDTTTARAVRVTITTVLGDDLTAALTTGEAVYLADMIERNAATLTAGATTDAEREARGHLLHLARILAAGVVVAIANEVTA